MIQHIINSTTNNNDEVGTWEDMGCGDGDAYPIVQCIIYALAFRVTGDIIVNLKCTCIALVNNIPI